MATGRTLIPARPFLDRSEAGRRLAAMLDHLRGQDVVVLGLPRGGVPVAAQVAAALDAPLDLIVVRKLGLPIEPEVAMGAIAEGDVELLDRPLIVRAGISDSEVHSVERSEHVRLEQRLHALRRGHAPIDLHGRTAVVVDDGLATGASARVACRVARQRGAAFVVVAVPVAPTGAAHMVPEADEVISLRTPELFASVAYHYLDFEPPSDAEIDDILDAAARRGAPISPAAIKTEEEP